MSPSCLDEHNPGGCGGTAILQSSACGCVFCNSAAAGEAHGMGTKRACRACQGAAPQPLLTGVSSALDISFSGKAKLDYLVRIKLMERAFCSAAASAGEARSMGAKRACRAWSGGAPSPTPLSPLSLPPAASSGSKSSLRRTSWRRTRCSRERRKKVAQPSRVFPALLVKWPLNPAQHSLRNRLSSWKNLAEL